MIIEKVKDEKHFLLKCPFIKVKNILEIIGFILKDTSNVIDFYSL